ncbi:hypothetical protein BC828DRAFT_391669 [Blastocladiella britannica]|nr:hypothetical protein BC828DRAFT_391669 [Blastocladiella britannica]
MPKHSKNNTASSVFTHAERERLEYGTKRQRLGRDSKRAFDACFLCLATAEDPLCCPDGHIACKECILSSLVKQSQDIGAERIQHKEARVQHERYEQSLRDQELQHRLDRAEQAISVTGANAVTTTSSSAATASPPKRILPSFWVPTLTPSVSATDAHAPPPPVTRKPMCLAGEPHAVTRKQLFPVQFQRNADDQRVSCPSCAKSLTNGSRMRILKRCGHVLCESCVKELVVPSARCNVCDEKAKDKDVIRLVTEGTGFASAGSAEAQRSSVAFH